MLISISTKFYGFDCTWELSKNDKSCTVIRPYLSDDENGSFFVYYEEVKINSENENLIFEAFKKADEESIWFLEDHVNHRDISTIKKIKANLCRMH